MTAQSAILPDTPADSAAGTLLRSTRFRKERESGWRELDKIVTRVEKKGLASLSAEEAVRLPSLYRAAVSSLSVARTIVLDRNLLLYLESLALRSYLVVYGPRSGIMQNLHAFFTSGFPRTVRSMAPHLAIAFLALTLGGLAGYLLTSADMSYFTMLIPESVAQSRGPSSSTAELRNAIFTDWPGFTETFIVFANFLFRHNTIVGLLSFGLSFALGLPTLLLLAYNGAILGAFIALYASRGLGMDFVAWVSIHGVTEILAILLCGAAGLVIAEKILFPGKRPRLDSLAHYGRKAASVAAGAVLLFFIAGILEGGFRQLIDSTPGRALFAVCTAAAWAAYFSLCAKGDGHGRKN